MFRNIVFPKLGKARPRSFIADRSKCCGLLYYCIRFSDFGFRILRTLNLGKQCCKRWVICPLFLLQPNDQMKQSRVTRRFKFLHDMLTVQSNKTFLSSRFLLRNEGRGINTTADCCHVSSSSDQKKKKLDTTPNGCRWSALFRIPIQLPKVECFKIQKTHEKRSSILRLLLTFTIHLRS